MIRGMMIPGVARAGLMTWLMECPPIRAERGYARSDPMKTWTSSETERRNRRGYAIEALVIPEVKAGHTRRCAVGLSGSREREKQSKRNRKSQRPRPHCPIIRLFWPHIDLRLLR